MSRLFKDFIQRLDYRKPKIKKFTPRRFIELSLLVGVTYITGIAFDGDHILSPIRTFHYKYVLQIPEPPTKLRDHELNMKRDMIEFEKEIKKGQEKEQQSKSQPILTPSSSTQDTK